MSATLDHMVVAARTLDEGVAWCEATLGVTPGPGGRHALMGTHNQLFSIATAACPTAYFEIIAIDPGSSNPGRARWFDLDQPTLQQALASGPKLIHWVLGCDDIAARRDRLHAAGIERGEVLEAERASGTHLLRWRISVRPDGARGFDGALPTLIQWGDHHPSETMPPSGVTLERLEVTGLPPAAVRECAAPGVAFATKGGAPLVARLLTPRGPISLASLPVGGPDVQS